MSRIFEVRCPVCNRKMGFLDGRAELKCPRCNTLTVYITSEKTLIASIVREDGKTQTISSEKTEIAGGKTHGSQSITR